MAKSSYYTPRCMAFKTAFKDMPGVTTFEHELVKYDGQRTDFDGSAYVDKLEWVAQSSPRNTRNNNGCSDIMNRLTGL